MTDSRCSLFTVQNMNEIPGYDFTEAQAVTLVASLQHCVDLLNETAAYVAANCGKEAALRMRKELPK